MEHFGLYRTPHACVARRARGFTPYHFSAKSGKGFTLIELLVVLTIIVTITAVAITSQSAFNKSIVLANAAYDVALTLRSTQTYGLGSRAAGTAANVGYGLHFNRATPGEFVFFADTYPGSTNSACHPVSDPSSPAAKPGNCAYDASQGEHVVTYKLNNAITINNFCTYALGSWSCASGSLTSMDVVFARPNPDPFVGVNGMYSASYPVTRACVSFTSTAGGERYISVSASGAIVANATSCP